jgi:5-methyltetrahydropteroyltriglutamate--homocysteine methyltransferase
MTITTANLGFPRIGAKRELKFALESYWAGKSGAEELIATAKGLRAKNWTLQKDKGIDVIPSNDFSLYDHVLDTAVLVGAIPAAYDWAGGPVDLDTYFAMARGSQGGGHASCGHAEHGHGVPALEMTKWFDTNYHYMVPEFTVDQVFELTANRPLEAFQEAKAMGIHTRPVILGPLTFLKLGKAAQDGVSPISLLGRLLPVYERLLTELSQAGVDWVQIDEPCLVLDLSDAERAALVHAYETLRNAAPGLKVMLATYFGAIGDNLEIALKLPVAGLHVDLVRAPQQAAVLIDKAPADLILSLGVIDGRNVWRADLAGLFKRIQPLIEAHGHGKVQLAPSSSLLHVPIDLALETALDPELVSWLAFATQKLDELAVLARAFETGSAQARQLFATSIAAAHARLTSVKVHDPLVAGRLKQVDAAMLKRTSPFAKRQKLQQQRLRLPLFPTTTIGSFPQTADVRKARSKHAKGELSYLDYQAFLERETEHAIRWQEEIGLDVLVHGEFELVNMVAAAARLRAGLERGRAVNS